MASRLENGMNGVKHVENGFRNGVGNGFINGVENGLGNGVKNGFANGHENGFRNGHENGFRNGHENGFGNGHENGFGNGHEHGFVNGVSNGSGNGVENGANDLQEYLQTGVDIARIAGKVIRTAFPKVKKTKIKFHSIDLVTETDELVENIIISSLKKRYPTHSFIGEESTAATGGHGELTDNPTWIIDPIDGTTNFVHTYPFAVISIALAINKQLVVGIIYNPMADEMYTATKGGGAFCNNERIHVSGREEIKKSLLCIGCGPNHLDTKLENLRTLFKAGFRGLRNTGSAAANLCYVAKGCFDVFNEYGIFSWDIAAGILIVQEAGGAAIDPTTGGPVDLMSRRILVAASEKLASSVAAILIDIDFPREK